MQGTRLKHRFGILLVVVLALAGCASADISERRSVSEGNYLAKPGRILVYNVGASPGAIPPTSALTGHFALRNKGQTAEEIATGRRLGAIVAVELVKEILAMGMPAERARGRPANVGDLVISGAFVSLDEGNRVTRLLIGFGAGSAKLKTLFEGYQVTPTGLKPLGSARIKAKGGKMPGILVPVGIGAATDEIGRSLIIGGTIGAAKELGSERLSSFAKNTAKEAAKVLRDAFKRRGWI